MDREKLWRRNVDQDLTNWISSWTLKVFFQIDHYFQIIIKRIISWQTQFQGGKMMTTQVTHRPFFSMELQRHVVIISHWVLWNDDKCLRRVPTALLYLMLLEKRKFEHDNKKLSFLFLQMIFGLVFNAISQIAFLWISYAISALGSYTG